MLRSVMSDARDNDALNQAASKAVKNAELADCKTLAIGVFASRAHARR